MTQHTEVIDAKREPVAGWANYRGRLNVPYPGIPMGPNTLGEWLWPVRWQYDDEADRTRIGFAYTAPNVRDFVGTKWDPDAHPELIEGQWVPALEEGNHGTA